MQYYLPDELISDDVGIDEYDQDIVWKIEEEVISSTLDTGIYSKKKSSNKIRWQKKGEKKPWIENGHKYSDGTIDDSIYEHRCKYESCRWIGEHDRPILPDILPATSVPPLHLPYI